MMPGQPPAFDVESLFEGADDVPEAGRGQLEAVVFALDRLRRDDPPPSPDLPDRIMAALAAEPAPAPLVAALVSLGEGQIRRAFGRLADAGRVLLGAGRPLAVRAQAAALLVAAALLLGALGGGLAVGAPRLFGLQAPAVTPSPTPVESVVPSPSPTPSPSPSPAVSAPPATEGVEPTGTPEPSETPEGGGSPAATETPEPTRTPAPRTPPPTKTPNPTETPEPSETPEGDRHDGEHD